MLISFQCRLRTNNVWGSRCLVCYLTSTYFAAAGRNGYFILCALVLVEGLGSAGVAIFLLIVSLAELIASAPAGIIVDRVDRRRLAIASNLARLAITTPLGFTADQAYMPWMICLGGALFSICDRLSLTASYAMIPELAEADKIENLNPTVFLLAQVGNLSAALLASIVVDADCWPAAFATIASLFLVSAVSLMLMRMPNAANVFRPSASDNACLQIRSPLVGLSLSYSLFYGAAVLISVAGAGYALEELRGGAAEFAYMEAAWAFGSILGAMMLKRLARWLYGGALKRIALLTTAVALCLLKVSPTYPAYVIVLLLGVAQNVGRIDIEMELQRSLPDVVRGRAKGLAHSLGAGVGLLVFGFVTLAGGSLSPSSIFAFFGLVMLPVSAIALLLEAVISVVQQRGAVHDNGCWRKFRRQV